MFNPDLKPPAELIPMSTANINSNCAEALDGERARVDFCSSGLEGSVQSVTPESTRHKGKAKTPGCSGLHFLNFNCAASHCREMEVSEGREADLTQTWSWTLNQAQSCFAAKINLQPHLGQVLPRFALVLVPASMKVAGDGRHAQVQLPLLHEDALQVVTPHGPRLHQHIVHLHGC